MSRFLSSKYASLAPYTPGEQPQDMKYIKLNTNESPFTPSKKAVKAAAKAAKKLQLYPDPECKTLVEAIAKRYAVDSEEVVVTNGSDEVLNFAFMAYCDKDTGAAAPDISYGFYPVFAQINNIDYTCVKLKEDFTVDVKDYFDLKKTIFIANPNAPTGIALKPEEIEQILIHNPNNIVVIDEAYVDFGAESCAPLIKKYDNLLVTMTFSKSRSMAGGRLGFGIANKEIIKDLNAIRFSTNPYNINSMTLAAGLGILEDDKTTIKNCKTVAENREYTVKALQAMGFTLTPSLANFIFATHNKIGGEDLYKQLKRRGILVRHFNGERIKEYIRITVGTKEQMKTLIKTIAQILEDAK